MEGEAKVRGSRCRRRERAARMQKQALRCGQSADEGDESPGRSPAKPPRPPNRKKRNKEPVFEEDVIDGFAILSFRTYEDLEVSRPNLRLLSARACHDRLRRRALGPGDGQPLLEGPLAAAARPGSARNRCVPTRRAARLLIGSRPRGSVAFCPLRPNR
ncbi:hypothetical protein HPB48_006957 [Haemaphysalis longicornis]|uniref:Uncharacterized protein n=1 Tax=Haemaphysalis longicornis TaxID=44386 RepID=A0A9J6GFM1_HAELO|nr:hypothetical protein HPB48_006957 [Haemaphysalis longicornis]